MITGKQGIWTAIAIVVVFFVCIYTIADPETGVLFPKCPFFALTGLQCPGCGSPSIPFLAVLGAAEITRKSHPKFHAAINSPKTAITVLVVVIAWWIVRNIISI